MGDMNTSPFTALTTHPDVAGMYGNLEELYDAIREAHSEDVKPPSWHFDRYGDIVVRPAAGFNHTYIVEISDCNH